MNTKQILAAATLAVLGTSAFAGGEFDPLTGFGPVGHSGLTRAEVRAETVRALQAGDVVDFDRGIAFAQAQKQTSTLTREAVKAEFARARAAGEIVEFDTGITYAQAPATKSTLTREQVREETRMALRGSRVAAGS